MSECKYIRRISAYFDNEVPPDERRFLERHLGECHACAQELERLGALRSFLQAAKTPELPPETLRRLHRACALAPARGLVRLATRLTLAAAAVLAISFGWLWQTDVARPPGPGSDVLWQTMSATLEPEADAETSVESQVAMWVVDDLSLEARRD